MTPEEKKARRHAYYLANKDKWKPSQERKDEMKAYYQANKDKWQSPEHKAIDAEYRRTHTAERVAGGRRRRRSKRAMIYDIKRQPCADCGVTYPPYVMDLDHRRGEKILDVSSLVDYGIGMKQLLIEIAKCDVVCSNCHRIRTHRDRGSITS